MRGSNVLTALLALTVLATRVAAQDQPMAGGGGGEDVQDPEITLVQPGAAYSQYPTIEIMFCDNQNLNTTTRLIQVNGANKTSSFSWSYGSGCTGALGTATTSTVALNLGSNTIYAYICDQAGNCAEETFSVTRYEGPGAIASLAPYSADIQDYSRCAMSCFAAMYAQATVPYFSFDTPRNVTLVYNGDRVNPRPFVHVDVTHGAGGDSTNMPLYFSMKVRYNGVDLTLQNGSTELRFAPQSGAALRLGAQIDPSTINGGATGSYPITVVIRTQYSSDWFESSMATRLIVVNNTNSAIARGWFIGEIQRAYIQADGSVLMVEGDGSATYFQKSGSNFITPTGDFTVLVKSGSGGSTKYRRFYPDSTRAIFDAAGGLDSVVDRFGNRTQLYRDGSGRPSVITDPSGSQITFNYGANGLDTIISPLGRRTRVAVQSNGRLTSITDPDGGTTALAYDGSLRLDSITDREGTLTRLTYHPNGSGKIDSIVSPSISVFGDSTARPRTVLDAWQFRGVPYGSTTPPVAVPLVSAVRAYVTDAQGHTGSMRVDRFGQPLESASSLGDTVTVTYNSGGQPTQIVDRLGVAGSATYDASGFMTQSTVGVVTMNFRKGGWGQPDSIWGEGMARRLFLNSSNGRIDSVRTGGVSGLPDSLQSKVRYTYDSRGRLLIARDNMNHLLGSRSYYGNSHQNTWKDSTGTGAVTSYTYDGWGRLATVSVPGQPVRTTEYDSINRPIRQYDGVNANPVRQFYGGIYLDSLRDPRGQTYRFVYNAVGWLTSRRDANDSAETFQYSPDGLLRRHVNRRGQNLDSRYDSLHRLIRRISGSGDPDSFSYSSNGREITAWNSNAWVKTYLNATHGQPDSIKTVLYAPGGGSSQGYVQRFSYTAEGWLTQEWFTGAASLLDRTFKWRANVGALDSMRIGTGLWTRFGYNPDRLTTITRLSSSDSIMRFFAENHGSARIQSQSLALDETYGFDVQSRLTLARDMYGSTPIRQFSYDSLGHLRKTVFGSTPTCQNYPYYGYVCTPGQTDSTHSFAYDEVGNRTDHSGSYDVGNRISSFDGCSYTTPTALNLDGAVRSRNCDGNPTFTWSPFGLMTSYTTGGITYALSYDALGRLVRRDSAGVARNYFLWGGDVLVAELAANGTTVKAQYSYYPGGLDNLHAIVVGGTQYNAHTDAIGNVRALTNAAGAVMRRYRYDEWGELASGTDSLPFSGVDRARFKGALWMGPELDLYYMRNRWYESRTGRFLSEDPIGLSGGINPYSLAGSDPINGSDPTGLTPCEDVGFSHMDPKWGIDAPGLFRTSGAGSFHPCEERGPIGPAPRTSPPGKFVGGPGVGTVITTTAVGILAFGFQVVTDIASLAMVPTAFILGGNLWPNTPAEMDDLLGFNGERVPDGDYPGRGKVVWRPNENTTITFEQHPYDVGTPDYHTGPHWHLDTPGRRHRRHLPGMPMPGF